MTYYCYNCESKFVTGWDIKEDSRIYDFDCSWCGQGMRPLPEFETPEQFEKRTGKPAFALRKHLKESP